MTLDELHDILSCHGMGFWKGEKFIPTQNIELNQEDGGYILIAKTPRTFKYLESLFDGDPDVTIKSHQQ